MCVQKQRSVTSNMTLYEIDERIVSCVDAETGEIIDAAALDALNMARADKIENVACWAKDQAALAKALRDEANALLARARTAENRVESLKSYLGMALDGQRFTSSKAQVGFRRVKSVEILNEDAIPDEYLDVKVTVTPKKTDIRDAINRGLPVPGAVISERLSTIIK